jgi:hypothetical protein
MFGRVSYARDWTYWDENRAPQGIQTVTGQPYEEPKQLHFLRGEF